MTHKKLSYLLIGGVLAVVVTYASVIIYLSWPITSFTVLSSGVFGDSFGPLTALFSGLAFAGLIITIVMQKEALTLQKKEIKEQRAEFATQNETLKKQRFENTFFQLLKTHTDILNSIVIAPPITGTNTQTVTGRDCFKKLYDLYRVIYLEYIKRYSDWEPGKVIKESYNDFYENSQADTGPYFLFLYNMIRFIYQSDIEEKQSYANFVRAQLSYHELALLFYNCLSVPENNNMKPLIEEFSLFNNLPVSMLIDKENNMKLYEPEAFESHVKNG